MFVDASAVVAILNGEPEAEAFLAILRKPDAAPKVSPVVRYEAVVSLARTIAGPGARPSSLVTGEASRIVDAFFERVGAEMIDIDAEISALATEAARTYGKTVGHPAALNMGDCFAYACAKARGLPLLYKGEDFARTDLGRADLA